MSPSSRTPAPPAVQARLLADLRDRVLAPSRGPGRIGLEVELIPVDAETGRPLPIGGGGGEGAGPDAAGDPAPPEPGRSSDAVVQAVGEALGWARSMSAVGAPVWGLPGGAVLSFEPGGQLELSTPPRVSSDELMDDVEAGLAPVVEAGAARGVAFVCRGMDPVTPVEAARLRLRTPRYERMARHLDRIGPWGRRMMRQSAAIHVNLDLGEDPGDRWAGANALVPVLTAIFANSPRAGGRSTGHRSTRAHQWRNLDPGRTGLVTPGADPAAAYLAFALRADAFLVGPADEPAEPFQRVVEASAWSGDDPGGSGGGGTRASLNAAWRAHLTTLFPEVRPRGYLELRCFDALPLRWAVVPAVLAAGILYDPDARAAARELLPPPTPTELVEAGRVGLDDPARAERARVVGELAVEGARRKGSGVGPRSAERTRDFLGRFTCRGRDPGHDPGDRATAPGGRASG